MPELPEVETIVRDLRPHVVGSRVEALVHLNPAVVRYPDPGDVAVGLEGRTVACLGRRGKFIQLWLDSKQELVVHLGMTGTLTLEAAAAPLRTHTHLRLGLDSGSELRYRDPRRFGRVLLGTESELEQAGVMPRLGVEPFAPDFASGLAAEVLRTSRRPVKAVLLDQSVIAGCGNIYADEACFLARVRPGRRAWRLSTSERRRLLAALPIVMAEAIERRGTSFSDYRDGFGAKGQAFESLFVYGRGGRACVRCRSTLRQVRIAGRTTVFCGRCQS
ncbi:MAG: bifunctional DNA-formamidopyrimidine glycosylase/DNA-(apurinic or apyrimidinic site) lyase [Candidatus Dormibacteraeota bacterium]|nr:bifunctional DNA-formamidopyrimidine glycosylase/DNA-(apurinic or apyrimidinic site) lyase [Candidatus Dormibacteraeota bacterium]